MPRELRRGAKGTSRVDLSSASEPEKKQQLPYRGRLIQPAQKELHCAAIAEIPILPNNKVDEGVKNYFANKLRIREVNGKINHVFFRNERIDPIMNAKTDVPEKIFDRFGLIPYLPEGNTGVVVLGRRDDPFCPSSVEEFTSMITDPKTKESKVDPEYKQFYKMYDDWVALLQESPEDFKSFQETAKRYGATISDPSVLVGHPKIEAIPRAMEMYSDWSFSRQAKIPITTGKKINADRWHNTGISRLVDSDNEKPSAQGLIMQLGDMAYWVDYSSNGSTVIFLNQKIDNIGRLCQAELDLDKDEKIFKGKAGNGKLENFVTDYLKGESVAGTRVSLIRKDNSPIVFVPLISDAIISMGHISPVTKEQQSTLYIKY